MITQDALIAQLKQFDSLPAGATRADKQIRGQQFETFLYNWFELEKLEPRTRYRPEGEELDGSFVFAGRVFLLEAKWHATPIPASAMYAFKGKVDGKLLGTVGVFVSMSGYSEDAVDALTAGKSLNLILFDRSDVDVALATRRGFRSALKAKLRAAAEEGVVFYPLASQQLAAVGQPEEGSRDLSFGVPTESTTSPPEIVVICEGPTDESVLAQLTTRILKGAGRTANVRLVSTLGKRAIPRVLNSLRVALPKGATFIAVADGDGEPDETAILIRNELDTPAEIVVVDPGLESWLFSTPVAGSLVVPGRPLWVAQTRESLLGKAAEVDLAALADQQPSFRQFSDAVVKSSRSG